jgi:hypothetical protein
MEPKISVAGGSRVGDANARGELRKNYASSSAFNSPATTMMEAIAVSEPALWVRNVKC